MSVPPAQAAAHAPLVGRTGELAQVQRFLDAAAGAGAALLVSGDPGTGKTALLRAASDTATARGALVLRAAGVEFEADVGFSTLNQLLLPLLDGPVGSAGGDGPLAVALGLLDGPAPGRPAVFAAALDLLRATAARRPLVLVVDDLHWADRASAALLGQLAGHVRGTRIGLLAAYRSGARSFVVPARVTECELAPLDDAAASALVRRRSPDLAERVVRRVLTEAAGNPLALVELPSALTPAQRGEGQPLPPLLPLTRRLEEVFASRVRELPARTRELLLVAALEGSGDLDLLTAAATAGPGTEDLVRPAARARLVDVDPATRRLSFRHPLVRSTVVALSDLRERREAHRALAQALGAEPDRRAWHLSGATVGTDEEVAGLMRKTAHRLLRRGDAVGAVTALLRSAELTAEPSRRSRRLAEAAYVGADTTGELRGASRLLLDARRTDPGDDGSLRAAVAASYVLLNGEGDVSTAHRLLVGALEHAPAAGPAHGDVPPTGAVGEALQTLLFVCLWGQRPECWAAFRTARARLAEDADPLLDLQAQVLGDPARAGAAVLERLDAEIARLAAETDPRRIERVAQTGTFVDRVPACRDALWRVVRDGRDGGAVTVGLNALVQLCTDAYSSGLWDASAELADEGLRTCTAHGYDLVAWPFRLVQGLIAAARGEDATALAVADRMTRWALPRGVGAVRVMAEHVRALTALGQARFDDAFSCAAAISPAGILAPNVAHALWVVTDLVEAAVHSGRRTEAEAHVLALHEARIADLSPRLAFVVAGATAMTTRDDRFAERFESALATAGEGRWPFEVARLRLAYGERLRRARRTSASRVQLAAALGTFEHLGARPWAARSGTELRATGLPGPRAAPDGPRVLTPQEHQVALLAASGLTNRQIAGRLSISPRTVAAHLRQVFPKLDVASRTALRDAMARPTGAGGRARA
jgi:DNA-binding CsgD family transcriptional regulator